MLIWKKSSQASFVDDLGADSLDLVELMAKTGILFASLLAGVSGYIWLYLVSQPVTAKD